MAVKRFVHLHVHSYFSFEDGTASIRKLLERCQQLGMDTIALTDYDGLYGAVRLCRHAQEMGVKPVFGTELTLAGGHSLVLLAKNLAGYANLCKLISSVRLSSNDHSPECSDSLLRKYSQNLIALSGGLRGEISGLMRIGQERAAENALKKYLVIFKRDNFYLELQDHFLTGSTELNASLVRLAKLFAVGVVATNNVHFLHPEEYSLHQKLVRTSRVVHGREKRAKPNKEYYLKSAEEMCALFQNIPEAVENTVVIANACNVDLELGKLRVPRLVAAEGDNAEILLEKACRSALPLLYRRNRSQAEKQLDHELKIINSKQLADYFLIVRGIVHFAKASHIRVSCRGSASSSIVTYLLGISQVDPLENRLLFERFLNKERSDIPDIDLDFDSRRRDEVLRYILDKYGIERACMVATIPTFEARSALRELARASGMSDEDLKRLVAYLPYISGSKIRQALEFFPEMDASLLKQSRYEEFVEFAEEVSGFPHYLSVHLGGVVLWDHLAELVPMQRSAKGYPIAQFDKNDLEALGLIKTDILSLRMLGALSEAEERIRLKNPFFDGRDVPRDDGAVYALLRSTRTVGCFQLESPGMRQLLGRLQPERFDDIIASISLFRPGPMQADMLTPYLARRWGREATVYLHPKLKPILKETYGVIVFQEQVLRIAREIAGFSLGQADLLRRAITKEITEEELGVLRDRFVSGAQEQGIAADIAQKIFDKLAAFASFGFPKAHAASFARLAYESAYLKRYYPLQYFLGLLNNHPGLYPLSVLANETRRCGVDVLGIDINESQSAFAPSGQSIRTGLASVKGVGTATTRKILKKRAKRPFKGIDDFCERVKPGKKQLEKLILCGAFDTLERNRRKLLVSARSGQPTGEIKDFSAAQKSGLELELAGLTFSGHPLVFLRPQLAELGVVPSDRLKSHEDGDRICVAGLKVVLHTPPTRSGQRVVFLTLEDEMGLSDITVFSDVQNSYAKTIFGSNLLMVEGILQKVGLHSFSVVAEKVSPLRPPRLWESYR